MSSFGSATRKPFDPPPQTGGIETRQRIRPVQTSAPSFVWPTSVSPVQTTSSPFVWPTPVAPVEVTTQSVFPTLVNTWDGMEGGKLGKIEMILK